MIPSHAIRPFLRNAATEHGEGGGGSDEKPLAPAEALEKVKDVTLPMSQRLGVAIKALAGVDPTNQLAEVNKELTKAQGTISTQATEITDLKAKLTAAQSEVAARNSDVSTLEASNAELQTKVKNLEATEKDLERRAESKANEKVAALGFKASALPAADPGVGEKSAEDKIRELSGNRRTQAALYYQQHKKLPDWMN